MCSVFKDTVEDTTLISCADSRQIFFSNFVLIASGCVKNHLLSPGPTYITLFGFLADPSYDHHRNKT